MKERRQWFRTWRLPPVSTKGVQNVSVLVTWFIVLERMNLRHMWFVTHSFPDYLAKWPILMHNWLGLQGGGGWKVGLGHTLKPWERRMKWWLWCITDFDGITIKITILNLSDVDKCLTWDLVSCLLCDTDSGSSWSIYQKFVCWMCSFSPQIDTLWKE